MGIQGDLPDGAVRITVYTAMAATYSHKDEMRHGPQHTSVDPRITADKPNVRPRFEGSRISKSTESAVPRLAAGAHGEARL